MGKQQGVRLGAPSPKAIGKQPANASAKAIGKQPAKASAKSVLATAPNTTAKPVPKPVPKPAPPNKPTHRNNPNKKTIHKTKTTAAQTAASKALFTCSAELILLGKTYAQKNQNKLKLVDAIRQHKNRVAKDKDAAESIGAALADPHAHMDKRTLSLALDETKKMLERQQAAGSSQRPDDVSSSEGETAPAVAPKKRVEPKAQKKR